MNLMTFDVATVPDLECGRRLYGLADLEDADVARVMHHRHRQRTGHAGPLPAHQCRVAALTLVRRHGDTLDIESLSASQHQERTMIEAFFVQLERAMPVLVSWDPAALHLAVLHYRALAHRVASPRYWSWVEGETGKSARRQVITQEPPVYLAKVLGGTDDSGSAPPLHEVAAMLGLPGKAALDADRIWELYGSGDLAEISKDCDLGALTTYLVYLRFEVARGRLSPERHSAELHRLSERLSAGGAGHLDALAAALAKT